MGQAHKSGDLAEADRPLLTASRVNGRAGSIVALVAMAENYLDTLLSRYMRLSPCTCRVADLGPHYRDAEVVLVPAIAGSGLKIKLIEALAHGKAFVATSVGIQGVGEFREAAVAVADDSLAFANCVCELLADGGLWRGLEAAAQRFVVESFSPEAAYRPPVGGPDLSAGGRTASAAGMP